MKKVHNQYISWIDNVRKVRIFGCLGGWVLWGCIALLLLGFVLFEKLH